MTANTQKVLQRFRHLQRVRIVAGYDSNGALNGCTGTVVRLRRGDDGAWVQMDEAVPAANRSFPANDDRANHICLYPEECVDAGRRPAHD